MKQSLEAAESNSRSIAGRSKMVTLQTAREGGGRIFAIGSGCAIVDPVIKDLAKLMLSFSGFVSRGFTFYEWAILN
jgi:hypothetical protein